VVLAAALAAKHLTTIEVVKTSSFKDPDWSLIQSLTTLINPLHSPIVVDIRSQGKLIMLIFVVLYTIYLYTQSTNNTFYRKKHWTRVLLFAYVLPGKNRLIRSDYKKPSCPRIADRTASQHLRRSRDVIGHVTI